MELSIVIPCLNEIETIEICINKCKTAIKKMDIDAEIILADNGSNDGSVEIAKQLGARVVSVNQKGYGNALKGGINSAKGKYIIMADCDNSYDFLQIDKFYKKLKDGFDIVQGCRFPIGGGKIEYKAMPISHKYIGNPFFSFISKIFFSLPFNDVYCGYRGFNRLKFLELDHFSNGMVFAIENLIKFKVAGSKCAEIPVTLHRDGRKTNKSHLNTISDGWNTLRFLMITCPKWLFFFPSFIFFIISLFYFNNVLELFLFKTNYVSIENILLFVFYFLISFQIFMFGLFSSLIATKLKMLESKNINSFFRIFKMRYAFLISFSILSFMFIDHVFFDFFINNINLKKIFYYFGIFFSLILITNSFFVSLITIDQQNKKNI
ncbi:glycosyltransferase family 2 protein [Candidatus Pelagibacter sp. HIMB1748]|uniref:glycosyltransferase family 2 protein n=1 Tax=unclassified Candidatus Pelagibacter TaxID=2647897 RepID=UPI003F8262C6